MAANQPGVVAILYEHIHNRRKRFPVFQCVLRGYAVDVNRFLRYFPPIRADYVRFNLASVQPCHLDNVRVLFKIRVPIPRTFRNPGRFRVKK